MPAVKKTDYIIVLAAALLLSVPFFGLAPQVDAGYYGYISKALAGGFWPHRDIPVAQNSLGFYFSAAVFRIFGDGLLTLRIISLAFLLGFAGIFLKLAGGFLPRKAALAATIIALVFVCQPQIQRGLGRNYLLAVLFFLTCGMYFTLNAKRRTELFFAGLFTGLAVCFNESFLLCCAAPLVYAAVNFKKERVRAMLLTFAGMLAAFIVPVMLLVAGHSWREYISDMFFMGAGARVYGAYASRIGNLLFISWDIILVYSAALVLYRPWDGFADRTEQEKRLLVYFMPPLAVTVLVINTVREYHLQALAPFVVLTAVSTALAYFEKLRGEFPALSPLKTIAAGIKAGAARTKKYARVLAVCGGLAAVNTVIVGYDYLSAFSASLEYVPRYMFGRTAPIDDRTAHVLDLLVGLPHKRISTMSQFPVLFMDPVLSVTNPLVEDLSISGNSGGYVGLHTLTASLLKAPPDIYIGRRFADSVSYEVGFLGRFLRGNYIQLADFSFGDENYTPLRFKIGDSSGVKKQDFTDIYYSTAAFARSFQPVKTVRLTPADMRETGLRGYSADLGALMPPGIDFVIIEVRFDPKDIKTAELTSGRSTVRLGRRPLVPGRLYCAVFPRDGARLSVFTSNPAAPVEVVFFIR